MRRIGRFLIAIFAVSGFGFVSMVFGQETSNSDDVLKRAQAISSATGRPIFAVAGRST